MKLKYIYLIFFFSFFLFGCNDYDNSLGKGYRIYHAPFSQKHIIIKKGIKQCLYKKNDECCELLTNTVIFSNVSYLGVNKRYIYGLREKLNTSNSIEVEKIKLLNGCKQIQPYGYFIIDKETDKVKMGKTYDEFVSELKKLNIDISTLGKTTGLTKWEK